MHLCYEHHSVVLILLLYPHPLKVYPVQFYDQGLEIDSDALLMTTVLFAVILSSSGAEYDLGFVKQSF